MILGLLYDWQCLKLSVHPAHILIPACAPGECTLFQSISIHYSTILYMLAHKRNLLGARSLVPLHPVGAENKCLISNTA